MKRKDTSGERTVADPARHERRRADREAEYAARWDAGRWRGRVLRTESGDQYTVIYQGRRGGGAGPDFRDAVLARPDGTRVHGDVELHLRASGWHGHGHATDKRYAAVVLHVVFTPLPAHAPIETPLPLGGSAPIAVLSRDSINVSPAVPAVSGAWPCARLTERKGARRVRELLLSAGHARFAQREARFMRDIAEAAACAVAPAAFWTPRDRVLFVAIAEALGYGRDRDTLRAAGAAMLTGDAPTHVCAAPSVASRVERARIGGLVALRERWLGHGPWAQLSILLVPGTPRSAAVSLAAALSVGGGSVSLGRARIVAANVVLPFASAAGALDGDKPLSRRALAVYDALPGLPSNQITRLMARQLGLARLPTGAAAQQGLQHIWSEWCREKRCDACPCAGTSPLDVPSPRQDRVESATLSRDSGPER